MENREKFKSRLGFILISAGCAIGLGNVYRFPLITGANGGGFFVLIYLAFLILLGIPVMTCELAVGRASQRSIVTSFNLLEKPKQKWGFMRYVGLIGNYLLMMFYTVISGWMMIYFFKYATGSICGITDTDKLVNVFLDIVNNPGLMFSVTVLVIVMGFGICALGLQKGVEKITKVMMILLFLLIIGLVVYSLMLPNAIEGVKFYLIPSVENMQKSGTFTVISSAMGQAFFTLSIGIGSIAIFGSYIGKDRSLLGESITIVALDTFIAIMSGLIIFPACFSYGSNPATNNTSATFLFFTLSQMFNKMEYGRIVGTLFFLFMIFASMSTVVAVFENIVSFWSELSVLKPKKVPSNNKKGGFITVEKEPMDRWKIAFINVALMLVLVLPAVLSSTVLSDIKLTTLVKDRDIMDMEDFIVSNVLLPLGSLFYVLFCTHKFGWGWDNYEKEVNQGKGLKVPKWMRFYMKWILPFIIIAVFVISVLLFFIPIK